MCNLSLKKGKITQKVDLRSQKLILEPWRIIPKTLNLIKELNNFQAKFQNYCGPMSSSHLPFSPFCTRMFIAAVL